MSVPGRVVVCLLVLFAGCAGVTTSTGSTSTAEERTLTAAPVPTDEAPAVREGVDGRRLASLSARHEAALSDRSFTALGRRVVTGPVGVLVHSEWGRRVSADRDSYHAVRSESATWGWDGQDPVDRHHLYHAGDRTITRHVVDGTVDYEVTDEPVGDGPVTDLDDTHRLRRLFGAFEEWRVVRHPDGSLTLDGRGLEHPAILGASVPLADPHDATASVRVEPSGRVSRAAVRYRATTSDGTPVSVVEVRRYVAVGATVTERPPWYGAALTGAERSATATGDATER